MNQPRLISDQKAWEQVAPRLAAEPELALDTESNSMYAFQEQICLVQIGTPTEAYLLDPLAVKDLSALGEILAAPHIRKVLHGSDYDLRSFARDYGFRIHPLFDTEISARFLGMVAPNLAAVLQYFLDVDIPKSRKLQRSNWAVRPLSDLALEYAANDVRYLLPLATELRQRLQAAGRLEWVEEESARLENHAVQTSNGTTEAFLKVKGSDRLGPRELAVLKELFAFREEEAQRMNWPPFRIMRNESLLRLAQDPQTPLEQIEGLPPQLLRRSGNRIRSALDRGKRGPEYKRADRPRRANPWTPPAQARLQELKKWRNEQGAFLGLDPSLLWPVSSLERLALQPEAREDLIGAEEAGDVRAWQRENFAQELTAVLDQDSQASTS
ncbi:MAG: ribonuclease D [Dehalococcoidia bacterium]